MPRIKAPTIACVSSRLYTTTTDKLNSPSSVDAGCKATVLRIKAPTIACVVSDDFLYDEVDPVDMDDDARGDVEGARDEDGTYLCDDDVDVAGAVDDPVDVDAVVDDDDEVDDHHDNAVDDHDDDAVDDHDCDD